MTDHMDYVHKSMPRPQNASGGKASTEDHMLATRNGVPTMLDEGKGIKSK